MVFSQLKKLKNVMNTGNKKYNLLKLIMTNSTLSLPKNSLMKIYPVRKQKNTETLQIFISADYVF